MSAKREQTVWENLWELTAKMERIYSLKALCSAGILALSELSPAEREAIIERASVYPHSPKDVVDGAEADQAKLRQKTARRSSRAG